MGRIVADRVSKRFHLQRERADSVGRLLVRMLPGRKQPRAEPFWALQDVSFAVSQGESLGIVGNNGSGKSTLLKLLTRTMLPTHGTIEVTGRTSALIELGAGFHPDFSGRENVIINASLLGISRRDILQRMDDVIDFSGISEFIDIPVKYYSSGMQARLGFSVAIHVEPEILIVDEVLAVGDEAFQQQCMDRIFEMQRAGVSILLVSHDLGAVQRLMHRAIWLDKGVVECMGKPYEVVQAYRDGTNQSAADHKGKTAETADSVSLGGLSIIEAQAHAGKGDVVLSGSPLEIELRIANAANQAAQVFMELSLRRPDGLKIAQLSGVQDRALFTLRPGVNHAAVRLQALNLVSGRYDVDLALFGARGERIGVWQDVLHVDVMGAPRQEGVLTLPHEWLSLS